MIVYFAATGLFLFYCMAIPIKFALLVRFNGHTSFGAGISIFDSRYAIRNARMRAMGEKKHWPWKAAGLDLQKRCILPAALHACKHLLHHIQMEQLQIKGRLSLSDAAHTALICGMIQSTGGIIAPFLPQNTMYMHLHPDFSGNSDAAFLGMISVPAGHIILAALIGAKHYLTRRIAHGKSSH